MKESAILIDESLYLHPGEIYIGTDAVKVITVLGSCVSVIFYVPKRNIGAICHGLLPSSNIHGERARVISNPFNYVDSAIDFMLDELKAMGVYISDIQAKVFGGASVFPRNAEKEEGCETVNIGGKNVSVALDVLQKRGISIVARDLKGSRSRKLHFYPQTGDVYMKYVKAAIINGISPVPGDVV